MHSYMKLEVIESIVAQVQARIGVTMRGSVNPGEPRMGLSFWFSNYTRGSGPVFTIRPAGLKRHMVSVKFGAYARPCIELIQSRATPEDYALAHAFTKALNDSYDLQISGVAEADKWLISHELDISVTRRVSLQHDSEVIIESVILMMVPLIAAIAELIGYETEDIRYEDDEAEGRIIVSTIRKRERSVRNRLLCLSLHGEQCGVCGFTTVDSFGQGIPCIIEVHHIEPLSEIDVPTVYDPATDLIPLCPNCHRAIHKRTPAFTPDELKERMGL